MKHVSYSNVGYIMPQSAWWCHNALPTEIERCFLLFFYLKNSPTLQDISLAEKKIPPPRARINQSVDRVLVLHLGDLHLWLFSDCQRKGEVLHAWSLCPPNACRLCPANLNQKRIIFRKGKQIVLLVVWLQAALKKALLCFIWKGLY